MSSLPAVRQLPRAGAVRIRRTSSSVRGTCVRVRLQRGSTAPRTTERRTSPPAVSRTRSVLHRAASAPAARGSKRLCG